VGTALASIALATAEAHRSSVILRTSEDGGNLIMSRTLVLTVLLTIWLATGIVAGFVMGYRRHDRFSWWLLGVAFGPLLVPLALGAERRGGSTDGATPLLMAQDRSVPALIGIDDSREAATALTAGLDSREGRQDDDDNCCSPGRPRAAGAGRTGAGRGHRR
jgi:hypothetical protein